MKKLLLSILIVGSATFANAQKSEVAEAKKIWGIFQLTMSVDAGKKPNVEKQLVSLNNGLSHLNKAILNEKTKDIAETWSYKALFTSYIAYVDTLNLENSTNAQKDAEVSIIKAKALDTKGEEKENIKTAENYIRNTISGRGLRAYNAKNYNTAYDNFTKLIELNPQDTSMYMNVGLVAKLSGKYPEAIKSYKKMISFNVPDAKSYYSEIISISLTNQKDTTQALALIKEALVKYPDDPEFVGAETDIYIKIGDIAKSQELLTKLINKDPKKEIYQYLMGDTYYKQALLIQKDRVKLDVKKVKEFDALTAKMTALIDQSIPFYQKSLELNPVFEPSLEYLKQIYGFKGDTAKFNEIKKRLEAIPPAKN